MSGEENKGRQESVLSMGEWYVQLVIEGTKVKPYHAPLVILNDPGSVNLGAVARLTERNQQKEQQWILQREV
jgi:hypothetical protein